MKCNTCKTTTSKMWLYNLLTCVFTLLTDNLLKTNFLMTTKLWVTCDQSSITEKSFKNFLNHPPGHSCWIGATLPPLKLFLARLPLSPPTPLPLSDGLIPNLIFSSPKRHNCWTFLAQIFFSELLRVWPSACAALGGGGAGAQPQRVLQPLQQLLLRLHQGEREGERNHFLF